MALIPIKSQYVSLIVTFIFALSELVLLLAAVRWNCLFENKKLQRRGTINVRQHRTRSKLLAIAVTSIFVTLEIFNSFYSDPATIERLEKRPCTFLESGGKQKGFTNITSLSNIIALECIDANRTTIQQSAGNLFRDGDKVVAQCTDLLYSFSTTMSVTEEVVPSETEYFTECVPIPKHVAPHSGSPTEVCLFLYQKGNRVSFTQLIHPDDVPYIVVERIPLLIWHTDVNFRIAGLESELARRAAIMLLESNPSGATLRREVFTTDGVGMCDFKKQIDATFVSDGFIYALAFASALSFLALAASLFFRSQMCFDMSNPLHWAQKSVIRENFLGAEDPEVCCLDSEGLQFMVSTTLSKSNGLRQRMANIVQR